MKTIKFLSFTFLMLISYGAMAQEKTVSRKTKDTVLAPQVQSSKIRICAPSKSAFIKPLYVLDGKIADSLKVSKINPNDIESLKLLHGPEAKLLYGDQGANGAIIITRKK
ncbi:hypothetical protein [Flavobacterium tistrianum]|uniref:hypothetical protein n=1 Tax=Flavobacterium tistrianum TaxID=1685414 RepID=UPI000DAD77CA|nr:hypothetical protein [Flavobacterium tistrianum]KAF2342335.1 hypothetical protein DMB71_04045 [Flavobacterium tistrianum]